MLVLTNAKLPVSFEPTPLAVKTSRYAEQVTWRDAGTGELLAESDHFEPLTINSLTPPGFGGRLYYPTAVGEGFYILQPMATPKAE